MFKFNFQVETDTRVKDELSNDQVIETIRTFLKD